MKLIGPGSNLGEQGSLLTGLEKKGPYHCGGCVHRPSNDSEYCMHPFVRLDPVTKGRERTPEGYVKIDKEHECCKFVKMGKI